jgi:hypothetical protein
LATNQPFLDQLAQTFLCLVFLVSPNQFTKVFAGVALRPTSDAVKSASTISWGGDGYSGVIFACRT